MIIKIRSNNQSINQSIDQMFAFDQFLIAFKRQNPSGVTFWPHRFFLSITCTHTASHKKNNAEEKNSTVCNDGVFLVVFVDSSLSIRMDIYLGGLFCLYLSELRFFSPRVVFLVLEVSLLQKNVKCVTYKIVNWRKSTFLPSYFARSLYMLAIIATLLYRIACPIAREHVDSVATHRVYFSGFFSFRFLSTLEVCLVSKSVTYFFSHRNIDVSLQAPANFICQFHKLQIEYGNFFWRGKEKDVCQ